MKMRRGRSTSRLSQGILSAKKDTGPDPKLGKNLCMFEGSIQEKSYPQSLSEIYLGSRAGARSKQKTSGDLVRTINVY